MIFLKTEKKNNLLTIQILFQSTKSPHFPRRGKVGQLRKKKRVLGWSIYINSLCLQPSVMQLLAMAELQSLYGAD